MLYIHVMSSLPDIDMVRSYWNARPCNIRHSEKALGTKDYFDEVEARKYFVEAHIPGFARFSEWREKTVLEIGCGIGTDAVQFALAGADYIGTDLSNESLLIAKSRFEVYNLQGIFLEANAEEIHKQFPNQTFDLIYSFGVLHHTPNLIDALRSIRILCHQGSVLKMMVYAKHSWKSAMISSGLDQPEAQSGCPIANTYSREEISELLSQAGFSVNAIRQDHIFPYKVSKYVKYEYELEDWFAAMPRDMFESLQKELGWHLMIDASPTP